MRLLPAPKEVHRLKGKSVIKPTTTILISRSEDRTAAELLQQEVRQRTGIRLAIATVSSAPKTSGHISLARLSDHGLLNYLSSQGVKAGDELGSQGYVLGSAESGIIVAAFNAQGLSCGVQTLRQLLHGEGKSLQATALVLRDWPSMEWRGVHDDISRGPIPTLDYMKKQIRTLAEYKINLFGFWKP